MGVEAVNRLTLNFKWLSAVPMVFKSVEKTPIRAEQFPMTPRRDDGRVLNIISLMPDTRVWGKGRLSDLNRMVIE